MSLSRSTVAVVAIALLPVSAARAQAPARTVEAQGAASVKVKAPSDKKHEAPIRAAVEAAEARALPRAINEARAHAADLARLSGLTLGAIVSIADPPASPYGPFFGFYGTFGPDRFCGTIRTSVFKRGPDGKRRRVGSRTRHVCRVPPTVTSTVTVTFAAQ
ncbi:MAG TPA: SIMPL domain-containing protein [Solirubrobacteraceae bacterium]